MEFRKEGQHIIIKLSQGEFVMETVKSFCEDQNITAASFTMIGACKDLTLAFYDLQEQEYESQDFPDFYEVASFIGNIAVKHDDSSTLVHAHGVFADDSLKTIGGHVVEATVAAAAEVFMTTYEQPIYKAYDEATGLHLMTLDEQE